MALKIAARAQVPPFFVMEVLRAAKEREAAGEDVLHLEVGQPSTGAPKGVREAARRLLEADRLGYTEALGVPQLRAAIARWYRDRYAVDVPERRVVVTTGSSGAFLLGFLAAFDIGDRVALAAPGYPAYRNILTSIGVQPIDLPTGPNSRFQPTVEMLEALPEPPDGLIVASPSNPTGTMVDHAEMARLAAWCRDRGVRLVSDEVYHGIVYDGKETCALEHTGEAIVVNTFSKYFSMTGWRLGWMIVPEEMVRPVECLAQNLFISPPALSQLAAVAAFDCVDELEGHVARYARNRAILLEELPAAGFRDLAPADGAFYVYAEVSAMTDDSEAFCRRMLAETGVAATPGIDFDPARGRRYMRFSFAGSTETMIDAARRLRAWSR